MRSGLAAILNTSTTAIFLDGTGLPTLEVPAAAVLASYEIFVIQPGLLHARGGGPREPLARRRSGCDNEPRCALSFTLPCRLNVATAGWLAGFVAAAPLSFLGYLGDVGWRPVFGALQEQCAAAITLLARYLDPDFCHMLDFRNTGSKDHGCDRSIGADPERQLRLAAA